MRHPHYHVCFPRQACPNQTWKTSLCALGVFVLLWIPVSVRAQECGTVWTQASLNRTPGVHAHSVASNGSRLIVVGTDYNDPPETRTTRIWRSDNSGVSWTLSTTGLTSSYFWCNDIAYGDDRFVVAGHNSNVAVSLDDGLTWSEYPFPAATAVRCVTWDGSQFLAGDGIGGTDDNTGHVSTSPDGITWTRQGILCFRVVDIIYGAEDSLHVALCHYPDGEVYTSVSGTANWTQRVAITDGSLKGGAYGNGMFVAGGEDASKATMVLRSSDGITWTRSPTPNVGEIAGMDFDGNLFIGVGTGFCITSFDGVTWTQQTLPLPDPITYLYGVGSKTENGITTTVIAGRKTGERIFYSQCARAPFIAEELEDPLPCNNGSGQFCVTATGSPPLSYQWERDIGGGWGNISGAQSACYTINPVSTADQGQYRCRVWNDLGTVTSNSASLTVRFPPSTFSVQPQDQLGICEFNEAQFCVTVTDGTHPLNYQWERDTGGGWGNAPNGDVQCYTIDSVDPIDEGQYRCRVWDDCGTTISDEATLQVIARAKADFDCDDDVDQDDFGHFQACLSGAGEPQTDPACADAKLDGDTDVDAADFAKFLNCLSGPGITADVDCADG